MLKLKLRLILSVNDYLIKIKSKKAKSGITSGFNEKEIKPVYPVQKLSRNNYRRKD